MRLSPPPHWVKSWWERFTAGFNRQFNRMLDFYEYWVNRALVRPGLTVAVAERNVPAQSADLPISWVWHSSRARMPGSSRST